MDMNLKAASDYALLIQHGIDDMCRNNPEYVTVQEAAELLNVTCARVKKLASYEPSNTVAPLESVTGFSRMYITRESVENRLKYIAKYGKPVRGKARK